MWRRREDSGLEGAGKTQKERGCARQTLAVPLFCPGS